VGTEVTGTEVVEVAVAEVTGKCNGIIHRQIENNLSKQIHFIKTL